MSKEVRVSSLAPVEKALAQLKWHEHVTKRELNMRDADVFLRQSYNIPSGGSGSGPVLHFLGGCQRTNRAIALVCWALIDEIKVQTGDPKQSTKAMFNEHFFIEWMEDETVRELIAECSDAVKLRVYEAYREWLHNKELALGGQHNEVVMRGRQLSANLKALRAEATAEDA